VSRPPKDSKLSKREIGARVRALREEHDLTQAKLANALGLTQSNVSAMERGDRGVTVHQAAKLAKILQVTVDELLLGEKPSVGGNGHKRRDRRFWRRMQGIEMLAETDKRALLKTIDAFLAK